MEELKTNKKNKKMKTILLSIILINLNAISQDNLPDYNEILLSDERLNIPLIDKMLKQDHQVSEEAVVGDWQVLDGRYNTTLPDESGFTKAKFTPRDAKVVMSFEENGHFIFTKGDIVHGGSWELDSNNTVLYIEKEVYKRVDQDHHRIFIDGDIMHLIIRKETDVSYIALQKTEKKACKDHFIENMQAIVKSYNLNIALYYECILKDVFHPEMANSELNDLKKMIQNSLSDVKTFIKNNEFDNTTANQLTEVNKILELEEAFLNTLIAFNKNRSEALKNQFEQERSTVWKAVSAINE